MKNWRTKCSAVRAANFQFAVFFSHRYFKTSFIISAVFTRACGPPEKLSLALVPRSNVLRMIVKLLIHPFEPSLNSQPLFGSCPGSMAAKSVWESSLPAMLSFDQRCYHCDFFSSVCLDVEFRSSLCIVAENVALQTWKSLRKAINPQC